MRTDIDCSGYTFDGFDVSRAISSGNADNSPRQSVLADLFVAGDKMHEAIWGLGYRKGEYKLIEGYYCPEYML